MTLGRCLENGQKIKVKNFSWESLYYSDALGTRLRGGFSEFFWLHHRSYLVLWIQSRHWPVKQGAQFRIAGRKRHSIGGLLYVIVLGKIFEVYSGAAWSWRWISDGVLWTPHTAVMVLPPPPPHTIRHPASLSWCSTVHYVHAFQPVFPLLLHAASYITGTHANHGNVYVFISLISFVDAFNKQRLDWMSAHCGSFQPHRVTTASHGSILILWNHANGLRSQENGRSSYQIVAMWLTLILWNSLIYTILKP